MRRALNRSGVVLTPCCRTASLARGFYAAGVDWIHRQMHLRALFSTAQRSRCGGSMPGGGSSYSLHRQPLERLTEECNTPRHLPPNRLFTRLHSRSLAGQWKKKTARGKASRYHCEESHNTRVPEAVNITAGDQQNTTNTHRLFQGMIEQ
jgi:hypothetical protein